MKYKTSELTSALLDAGVAKALGWPRYPDAMSLGWLKNGILMPCYEWEPSSNWADGGPIIERERISILSDNGTGWIAAMPEHRLGEFGTWTNSSPGTTALEAAMREFVFAKIGAEVDLCGLTFELTGPLWWAGIWARLL